MQQSCIRPCKQGLKRRASYSVIRFTAPDALMLYCALSICWRWRKSSTTRKAKDILRLSEQEQALPGTLSSAVRKSNDDTRASPPHEQADVIVDNNNPHSPQLIFQSQTSDL